MCIVCHNIEIIMLYRVRIILAWSDFVGWQCIIPLLREKRSNMLNRRDYDLCLI